MQAAGKAVLRPEGRAWAGAPPRARRGEAGGYLSADSEIALELNDPIGSSQDDWLGNRMVCDRGPDRSI